MRKKLFSKIVILSWLFLLFYLSIKARRNVQPNITVNVNLMQSNSKNLENTGIHTIQGIKFKDNRAPRITKLKYILQWTSSKTIPFVYMGKGRSGFRKRNCTYTNCYVTSNRKYLIDYTKFDVIAFAGPQVTMIINYPLPTRRSPHQKYVFGTIESAGYYPVCADTFDGFFNWTWTYRLDSEGRWGYIAVRDKNNKVIGPNKEMNWIKLEHMDPVDHELKKKISKKTKAAAWFVSNCFSKSKREAYVHSLQIALFRYNLTVDIYGKCGIYTCSKNKSTECSKMLEKDYYFYLSFENALSEDYVTEKLLYPLQNNAVPIVYGGANYTRFMPDGIYLNAIELQPEQLAEKMAFLIDNPEQYIEYFRWKRHYSFHKRTESAETDDYCQFCEMINNKAIVEKVSIYENFKDWWSPHSTCSVTYFS